MKQLNTTNTIITLNDGSKVSKNFYDIIKNHAIARYDFLNLEENYDIDEILGEDLVFILNTKAASKTFVTFMTMVENGEVPYVESYTSSKFMTNFELMPIAADVILLRA